MRFHLAELGQQLIEPIPIIALALVDEYHFMVWAAALLPFLRDIRQCFDIASHPATSPQGLLSGGLTLP
jgi:hypothetical protein